MSTRKAVLLNVTWNWAGMAVNMAAGFLTAPFLFRRLGETSYGLWIVLASFSSYFGMLDLGVRGAVGRQMALRRAQGDRLGVNSILSTSLTILSLCGGFAFLATLGLSFVFLRVFDVPPQHANDARMALLLIGLNLALWLPLNVFDGTLWAAQRFDILNAIDVTSVLLRTVLTFALITDSNNLVTLAWLNLITLAGAQAAKGVASLWIEPTLRAKISLIKAETARELFGYGVWAFLINVARTLTLQASPLVIGIRLGVGFVTPFSVATRLIGYAGALIVAATGVLTPIATTFHAEGSGDRQKRLFAEGGKYCAVLSLFFVTLFLLLGYPLITFWMGSYLANSSSKLLIILALGEALPMSQWITTGVILGTGRHRPLAWANVTECVAAVALAALLAGPFGLVGVCVAFAVPGTLCRGVFQLFYGCRLVGIPARQYLAEVLAPPLAIATMLAAVMAMIVIYFPPQTTLKFLAYGAGYSLAYFTACGMLLIGYSRFKVIADGLVRKLSRA